ncbi:hypothetical protein HWV62_4327 [Athelia sp. TMB]|nr:hypothetical protein HWV62_4327 [Athelia sp. TMB]
MALTSALCDDSVEALVSNIEAQFDLAPAQLEDLTKAFLDEVAQGLSAYRQPLAMIPTFVTSVPNGTETGRVCQVAFSGDHKYEVELQKQHKIKDDLKNGEATKLFGKLRIEYLAECVDIFVKESSDAFLSLDASSDSPVYLGLTFSFPVEQHALDSGVLLQWTKGFSAKNAVGHDVVSLLQEALDERDTHVKQLALCFRKHMSLEGAIFGTGTNGAWVEDVKKLPSSITL